MVPVEQTRKARVDKHCKPLRRYSKGLLARAYRRAKPDERNEHKAMERASARPQHGELD